MTKKLRKLEKENETLKTKCESMNSKVIDLVEEVCANPPRSPFPPQSIFSFPYSLFRRLIEEQDAEDPWYGEEPENKAWKPLPSPSKWAKGKSPLGWTVQASTAECLIRWLGQGSGHLAGSWSGGGPRYQGRCRCHCRTTLGFLTLFLS